jgi:hypothetical protein
VRSRLRWCEQTAGERRRSRAITAVQVDGGTPAIRTLWRKAGGGPSECWGGACLRSRLRWCEQTAGERRRSRAITAVQVDGGTLAIRTLWQKVGGGPSECWGRGLSAVTARWWEQTAAERRRPRAITAAQVDGGAPRSGRFGRGPQRMLGEGLVCGHGFGGGSRQRLNAGLMRAQPTGSTTALPRSGRFGTRMLGELFESPSHQCCIGPLSRGTALRMKSEPAVRSTWK